jgi:hypothetical protein
LKNDELDDEFDLDILAYEEELGPYFCKLHGPLPVVEDWCGYCETEALARMERRIPNEELDDFPPEGYY